MIQSFTVCEECASESVTKSVTCQCDRGIDLIGHIDSLTIYIRNSSYAQVMQRTGMSYEFFMIRYNLVSSHSREDHPSRDNRIVWLPPTQASLNRYY